ncbi:MAG: nitroreductase family protein [Clostridia bacterium]
MNFTELNLKRESCRAYIEKEVDREISTQIIKEALNAPSACNSQPWKFVLCDGEKANDFTKFIKREGSKINQWTDQVPCFIVLCETKAQLMASLNCNSQKYAQYDAGLAAATICYSARDKGLGTCIIGVFDEAGIKEYLSIPEDVKISLIITLGYPKHEEPRAKMRKDLDDVLSYNNW